jgi:hypothetical protein
MLENEIWIVQDVEGEKNSVDAFNIEPGHNVAVFSTLQKAKDFCTNDLWGDDEQPIQWSNHLNESLVFGYRPGRSHHIWLTSYTVDKVEE